MKVRIFIAWFDLWVGAYWSARNKTLYICPLPCCVIALQFKSRPMRMLDGWICAKCGQWVYIEQFYCSRCHKDRESEPTVKGKETADG